MLDEKVGLILAGGQSRRMGRSKANLLVGNQRLVDLMIEKVQKIVPRVYVSGEASGHPQIKDEIPGLGPLGGIFSALKQIDASEFLIVPVDMPLLCEEDLQPLIAGLSSADAVQWEGCELPFALNRKCEAVVLELCRPEVPGRDRSVRELLKRVDTLKLRGASPVRFQNFNTPEEWGQFKLLPQELL